MVRMATMSDRADQAETEVELSERLFAERHDDAAWETDAADIVVRPRSSEVVSVRVPSDLLDEIERVTSDSGESISDFVRGAIASRLHGPVPSPPALDRVWSGVDRLVVHRTYSESRTESASPAYVTVPDTAPLTVQGSIRRGYQRALFPDVD